MKEYKQEFIPKPEALVEIYLDQKQLKKFTWTVLYITDQYNNIINID